MAVSASVPWKWVATTMLSLVILAATTWASELARRVERLEDIIPEIRSDMAVVKAILHRIEDKN